jgi:glutathione S-transferase
MTLKLYYIPKTRSSRARWMLEELGVDYELVRMTFEDARAAEYRKLHPLGAVPALKDADTTVFESAAIIAYLADRFPEKGFAPPISSPQRGTYYQWIIYSMATLEPCITAFVAHTSKRSPSERLPVVAEEARADFIAAARPVEEALRKHPFLLGDNISAADVVLGSVMNWADTCKLIKDFPALQAYLQRLRERPAFQAARKD